MIGTFCVQIQETDIDTLERCCAAMAYGDLEAESPHSLTETNFLRLFRLAQLAVEYLLHIQDRLVWETGLLKVALTPAHAQCKRGMTGAPLVM